jgi:hypothetical protein
MAMVNSLIPNATLPASDVFNDHRSPLEKLSLKITLPISGFSTSVGVTIGVEKGVAVAVGGNQITVSVGVVVEVDTGVVEGAGSGVSVDRQETNASDPNARIMTRLINPARQLIFCL